MFFSDYWEYEFALVGIATLVTWLMVRDTLSRSAVEGQSQQLDVLVIDAFSGDSIPIHLLTEEAFAVYLRHFREGGIIAFHVSNRYFNLLPVVEGLAYGSAMWVRYLVDAGDNEGHLVSRWALVK
ncbi:MAG: hypothetical protein O7F73_07960 [Gammaproteobacteria bacterium]|nr:hypothetical protein [Gammaproteobacteria bacterium]